MRNKYYINFQKHFTVTLCLSQIMQLKKNMKDVK